MTSHAFKLGVEGSWGGGGWGEGRGGGEKKKLSQLFRHLLCDSTSLLFDLVLISPPDRFEEAEDCTQYRSSSRYVVQCPSQHSPLNKFQQSSEKSTP